MASVPSSRDPKTDSKVCSVRQVWKPAWISTNSLSSQTPDLKQFNSRTEMALSKPYLEISKD